MNIEESENSTYFTLPKMYFCIYSWKHMHIKAHAVSFVQKIRLFNNHLFVKSRQLVVAIYTDKKLFAMIHLQW